MHMNSSLLCDSLIDRWYSTAVTRMQLLLVLSTAVVSIIIVHTPYSVGRKQRDSFFFSRYSYIYI